MKTLYILFPIFFIFLVSFTSDNVDNEKNKLILELMKQSLKTYHYEDRNLDNDFSEEVFDLYLKKIDYNKRFFLQSDINDFTAFKYKIDEAVGDEDFTFFNMTKDIYITRVNELNKYIEASLKKPFDFDLNEEIELDPEKRKFAADKKELKRYWTKYLKYSVMIKLASKLKIQEAAIKDKDTTYTVMTFDELEQKSRDEVKKTYDDWYHRITKINDLDLLTLYFNSIAEFFDPHSAYYPPKDKENFDIHISGKLEGIGATLSQPNAYIKVVRIVPGSACWKQGDLEVGDLILKVGQASKDPVDVVDMRLDEAIKMIRGKKGTEVRLTVKKADGSIVVIPIIRDVVIIEETFAKSVIITDSVKNEKIGYIYLPQFYADFDDNKGRRCSEDMRKEILKLKEENIEGLIIDLRDNGGGSLIDAIDIVGLLIESGPVVQVRSRYGLPEVIDDKDSEILYEDDLVIMVNEFSASASEIMAAAIQDYNRGIIVGSNQTFGKGTVQRFLPFDRMVKLNNDLKPLGDLKITIQKFYRINGGATQLRGVRPDIIFPDAYSELDMGEKDLDNPIQWDEIPKAKYNLFNSKYNVNSLKTNSLIRVSNDTSFQIISDYSKFLKQSRDHTLVSLNLKDFMKEEKERSVINKRFRNADNRISKLNYITTKSDSVKFYSDSIKTAGTENWLRDLKKDIYLEETYRIISDMN